MRLWLRLAVLLALLVGGPGWLLGTQAGLRASLALTQSLLGERLAVDQAVGSWAGPLAISGLRYRDSRVDVSVDTLALDWRPSYLLLARLSFARVEAEGVAVTLPQASATPTDTPFELSTPLAIDLDRLVLHRLRVQRPQAPPFELPQLDLSGFWRGAWIHVEHLALNHPQTGPLTARGDVVAAFGQLSLRGVRIEGPGVLQAQGSVALAPGETTELRLSWQQLRWPLQGPPELRSEQGQAQLEGSWEDLGFDAQFGFGARAQAQAKGRWAQRRLVADLSWTDLDYPWLDPQARWHSARGRAHVAGTPAAYAWNVDAAIAANGNRGELAAQGRGGARTLTVEQARFAGLGGEVQARGQLAWASDISADAELNLRSIDPGQVWPDWPGRLTGFARVRTRYEESQPQVEFELALRESELRGYPLNLQGSGRYAQHTLDLHKLVLGSGHSTLRVQGRVTEPYAFTAELNSPNLEQLWPRLRGRAQAKLAVAGRQSAPRIRLNAQASALAYAGSEIATLHVAADLHPTQASSLRLDAQGLVHAGRELQALTLTGEGTAQRHGLKLSLTADAGQTQAQWRGALDLRHISWRGTLESLRLAPRQHDTWQLESPAAFAAAADRITLDRACLISIVGRSCLALDWQPPRTQGEFSADRLELALLRPWLPADWSSEGAVSGQARFTLKGGALSELTADLHTTSGRIQAGTKARLDFLESRLTVKPDGQGLLAELDLRLRTGSATGSLRFEPGPDLLRRRFAGGLEVSLQDLSLLALATPEIAAARGQLLADFAFAGTLHDPLLDGELAISEGELQLALPGITLTELGLEFTTARGKPTTVAARASSGGGKLAVDGRIESLFKNFQGQFAIKGQDFQLSNTPLAKIWISPDLQLGVKGRRVELTGDLRVPKASLTPRKLDVGVAPSSDQVLVGDETEPATERIFLTSDVRLWLGPDVRFDGFGLKSKLAGDIRVQDEPGRYTSGRGELRLESGRYKAYGQELEIETGRLLFAGGPITDPGLELRAQRKPREDVKVGVRVRGTLERPEFSLFSEPAMPQEQQLAWLVLGRPLEESVSTADRERISGAALSLGLASGDFVAQRLGSRLRLDEVSLGAKPGETADQARLTIGKYLSPRLFVSYGFGLFQPGRYFKLLYDIGHGFKLQTETGVNTGGDLLYTIER